jgi:hypothetical protein
MTRRIQSPEEIPLTDISIYSLDIVIPAIILDTKQYIVNPIEDTVQKMSKEVRSSIQRKETIICSLLYKISMLNAKDATIMAINPINVDYQCSP